MSTKNSGLMNQTNTSMTVTIREWNFLEQLYKSDKIKNYTYDGWIQLGTEWVPTTHGLKKIGVYNEYLEHSGK